MPTTVTFHGSASDTGVKMRVLVDADADGNPFEPTLAPPRLDENSAELSLVDVEIIWPLESHRLRCESIESSRQSQAKAQ